MDLNKPFSLRISRLNGTSGWFSHSEHDFKMEKRCNKVEIIALFMQNKKPSVIYPTNDGSSPSLLSFS